VIHDKIWVIHDEIRVIHDDNYISRSRQAFIKKTNSLSIVLLNSKNSDYRGYRNF